MAERRHWWVTDPFHEPMLPHPRDKVPPAQLAQAKIQAVEAMQEFGVLVEASRASGMGRYQLLFQARPDEGDVEFAADIRKARRECQERLEAAFVQRGMTKGGDLAGIFYLKHNTKRYREVQRVELTGRDGAPLNMYDAAKAELLTRLAKLAGSGGSAGLLGAGESESREGLEGREEIVLSGPAADHSRPVLVKTNPGKRRRTA